MIYLNGQPLNVTIFPDKTSQVWKIPENILNSKIVSVEWEFSHEGEFMHISQLKTLLRSLGIKASLYLTYLPYARQDKEVTNTSTFAFRTFAGLINSLEFENVTAMDPHSSAGKDYIIGFKEIYPHSQLKEIILDTNVTIVCYPDKGALVKYSEVYKKEIGSSYIYGEKVRDQLTGNILSYKLVGECKDENVLIVDDICDGGMTFKILAKDLLAKGAKSVVLFVTHGIFSRGLTTLFESGIQRVYTQDGEASEHEGQIIYRRL